MLSRILISFALLKKECCSINTGIATKYLTQVQFHYGEQTWKQVALGFINDCGGYEIRNAKFKSFIHPKADQFDTGNQTTISSINIKEGKLDIFEEFMDFLSYLNYQNIHGFQSSVVVLNSVSNYGRVQELLQNQQLSKVYFFLDNDEAGKDTVKKLTSLEDKPVSFDWKDMLVKYVRFKDFNEFLSTKRVF